MSLISKPTTALAQLTSTGSAIPTCSQRNSVVTPADVHELLRRVNIAFFHLCDYGYWCESDYGICHNRSKEQVAVVYDDDPSEFLLPAYVFYTTTDVEHLSATGRLFLSFGTLEDYEPLSELAETIIQELTDLELQVVWDFNVNNRICVQLPVLFYRGRASENNSEPCCGLGKQ